ncbi:nitronate monooxygenase family protein [Hydrogenophaga sp.]|uniref:NAD(P)H-dependent flavin oxidoreductase n=1 Tax=Hydrogenophaga sp. TaxID=1904254 RepID=UPI00271FF6C0|nr:nitronate monooxygenase [Hydrogenophaga sp.]MDO9433913.1 nitronate monooxygenase [Hydrogenophaga sp.]
MTLPVEWRTRLRLPLMAAPMLHVSGPALVAAACRAGVIGAFPAANCRQHGELSAWIARIREAIGDNASAAPFAVNLIVRSATLADDLARVIREKVELVITSVGSPAALIGPLHGAGCRVFADVATLAHAEKALAAGADGLVLLCAGAGGQSGWVNPFAGVRSVRALFDGPLIVAGGLSDGHALWAALALGADLGYMGTRFIATHESLASDAQRRMLVQANWDDIVSSSAFTGLPVNWLRASLEAAGLNPDALDATTLRADSAELFGTRDAHKPRRWTELFSAGHSVSGVHAVQPVANLVDELAAEYDLARQQSQVLAPAGPSRFQG